MKNSKLTSSLRIPILLLAVVVLSNGCGIIDPNGELLLNIDFLERSLFDSLSGIY